MNDDYDYYSYATDIDHPSHHHHKQQHHSDHMRLLAEYTQHPNPGHNQYHYYYYHDDPHTYHHSSHHHHGNNRVSHPTTNMDGGPPRLVTGHGHGHGHGGHHHKPSVIDQTLHNDIVRVKQASAERNAELDRIAAASPPHMAPSSNSLPSVISHIPIPPPPSSHPSSHPMIPDTSHFIPGSVVPQPQPQPQHHLMHHSNGPAHHFGDHPGIGMTTDGNTPYHHHHFRHAPHIIGSDEVHPVIANNVPIVDPTVNLDAADASHTRTEADKEKAIQMLDESGLGGANHFFQQPNVASDQSSGAGEDKPITFDPTFDVNRNAVRHYTVIGDDSSPHQSSTALHHHFNHPHHVIGQHHLPDSYITDDAYNLGSDVIPNSGFTDEDFIGGDGKHITQHILNRKPLIETGSIENIHDLNDSAHLQQAHAAAQERHYYEQQYQQQQQNSQSPLDQFGNAVQGGLNFLTGLFTPQTTSHLAHDYEYCPECEAGDYAFATKPNDNSKKNRGNRGNKPPGKPPGRPPVRTPPRGGGKPTIKASTPPSSPSSSKPKFGPPKPTTKLPSKIDPHGKPKLHETKSFQNADDIAKKVRDERAKDIYDKWVSPESELGKLNKQFNDEEAARGGTKVWYDTSKGELPPEPETVPRVHNNDPNDFREDLPHYMENNIKEQMDRARTDLGKKFKDIGEMTKEDWINHLNRPFKNFWEGVKDINDFAEKVAKGKAKFDPRFDEFDGFGDISNAAVLHAKANLAIGGAMNSLPSHLPLKQHQHAPLKGKTQKLKAHLATSEDDGNLNKNSEYNKYMNDIVGQIKQNSYLFMDAGLIGLGALLLLPRVGINAVPPSFHKLAWTASLGAIAVGILGHMANPSGRAFAGREGGEHGGFGGGGGGPHGGAGHFEGGHIGGREHHEGGHGFGHEGHFGRGGHWIGGRWIAGWPGYYGYGYPYLPPYDPYALPPPEPYPYPYPYPYYGYPGWRGWYGGRYGWGRGLGHYGRGHEGHFGGHHEGGGHEGGHAGGEHGHSHAHNARSFFAPAIFPQRSYFNNKSSFKNFENGVTEQKTLNPSDVLLPREIDTSHYMLGSRPAIIDRNLVPAPIISDVY